MIHLDVKDRKILTILDRNSRLPLSRIAKETGLPKTVVSYRINRLRQSGVIKRFYTVIDASRLGYMSLRVYLTFQDVTPQIEQEIIDFFIRDWHTYWVGSIEGRFDLVVIMWVRDINDFQSFWDKVLTQYQIYFEEQHFSIYLQLLHFRHSYLVDGGFDRSSYETTGGSDIVNVDSTDISVLNALAPDARIPLAQVARLLRTTTAAVKYRYDRLSRLGVVQGFRTHMNINRLGYQYFKVDLYFRSYSQVEEITNYVKLNPYIIYIDKSAGFADLEFEFHLPGNEQLNRIMDELILRFPGAIKNYKHFLFTKVHKMFFAPE
ncbi:MAG: Lrp/AsnC family transcriptional regulator [archaeon]